MNNNLINSNKLFYIVYFLALLDGAIERTHIDDFLPKIFLDGVKNFYLVLLGLLFFINLIQKRWKIKELFLLAILSIYFIVTNYYTDSRMTRAFLLIVCAKDADFNKIIRLTIKVYLFVFFISAALALSGKIDMGIYYRSDKIRYALGFRHPNSLGTLSFVFICMVLYLYKDTLTYWKYLITAIIVFAIFIITNSNTALLMSVIIILMNLFYQLFTQEKMISGKWLRFLLKGIVFFLIIFALIFFILFWNNMEHFQNLFNDLFDIHNLVARFRFSKYYLSNNTTSLFGSRIYDPDRDKVILDTYYIWMYLKYGVIFCILFIILEYKYMRILMKKNEITLLFIFLCYLIYAISENTLYWVFYNPFLMHMGIVLFEHNRNGEKTFPKTVSDSLGNI